jgi:hypothetical protein
MGQQALAAVQYRSEHSRSLDQAPRYQAIETLKNLGVLIPLDRLTIYHGRAYWQHTEPNEWAVQPDFKNGSNDSGNDNVNARPTLYTADEETAIDFANARAQQLISRKLYIDEATRGYHRLPQAEREQAWSEASEGLEREIHQIVSRDPDAVILNSSFTLDPKDSEQIDRYMEAMKALLPAPSRAIPVKFEQRDIAVRTKEAVSSVVKAKHARDGVAMRVTYDDLAAMPALDVAEQMAAGANARLKVFAQIVSAARSFIAHDEATAIETVGEQRAPISLEYVAEFFHEAHIVGMTQNVDSATLGKSLKIVTLFDLDNVNTIAEWEHRREQTGEVFGTMSRALDEQLSSKKLPETPLLRTLENPYSRPEQIIEAVTSDPLFARLFEADAGNWEGFTLAEHTETVLRNFDENFADILPVELLKPMRLALVVHDIGKPVAVERGEKHRQKEYNTMIARHYLTDDLGVDRATTDLLVSLIGESQERAFKAYIRKQPGELASLKHYAETAIEKWTGSTATPELVRAYMEMAKMLLICDGGAYTDRAVTRKKDGSLHRNAGSFNSTFRDQPNDPRRRRLSLK